MKDDIIRMAREAGFHAWYSDPDREYHFGCAVKFAALVAAPLLEALDEIDSMPCSMVNDSESLRHTIQSIKNISSAAIRARQRGYATGHGKTMEDLLKELEWQSRESEREAIAKMVEGLFDDPNDSVLAFIVDAIRARGNT